MDMGGTQVCIRYKLSHYLERVDDNIVSRRWSNPALPCRAMPLGSTALLQACCLRFMPGAYRLRHKLRILCIPTVECMKVL